MLLHIHVVSRFRECILSYIKTPQYERLNILIFIWRSHLCNNTAML